MRLFAALPLSPECVERLTKFRLRWNLPQDGLRWSPPEQWHITLGFFGDIEESYVHCLERRLQQLTTPAPVLIFEGLDLFAAKGILVAAICPSPALSRLHEEVADCGKACHIPIESRPFRPHVTLARSKGKKGNASLQQLAKPQLPTLGPELRWTADECLLLESLLRPQGAEYIVRSRVKLAGEAAPPTISG